MGARAAKLRGPLRRKLATELRGRPWMIEIEPNGVITVWLRRLKRESIHVSSVYALAVRQRLALAKARKGKTK